MATVLETLVVKLAGDAADYDKTIKKAKGSLDGFAKKAKDIGGKLSLAVTTPILAIGTASLNMASDLNETISKVDTLFGDQAASIQAWADDSATAFGLSKEAALDNVGTLGNMFMQLGAGNAQAATLSQGMVELSADIASFHNVAGGSTEVLDAMTSAFRGEYDALQRYIPTINAAAVEQTALAMTGKESAKELTNLEKALAVQAIITKDAGAAVGDFARTSDDLANTQRILQAELANVSADLGQELLPIALEVAKGLRDLLGRFSELSPETKKWILIIAGVAAAAGPVIGTIGAIAGAISTVSGLIAGAGGLTALVGGLGTALAVLTGPVAIVIAAVAGLALAWNTDFLGIKTKTQEFWGWLTGKWPGWMGNLKSGWQGFSDWWKSDTETKWQTLKTGWSGFTGWLGEKTSSGLATVKGYWQSHQGEVQGIAQNQWDTLKGIVQIGMDGAKGFVTAGLQFMRGDWEGGMETLRSTAESIWGNVKGIFENQLDNIRNLFAFFGWPELGDNIARGIADGITSGLTWITNAAQEAAQAALNAAKSWLGISSPSKVAAQELGEPFTQGVGVGATRAMPRVSDRIQSALDSMMGSMELSPVPAMAGVGAGTGGNNISITIYADSQNTANQARMGVLDGLRQAGLA